MLPNKNHNAEGHCGIKSVYVSCWPKFECTKTKIASKGGNLLQSIHEATLGIEEFN